MNLAQQRCLEQMWCVATLVAWSNPMEPAGSTAFAADNVSDVWFEGRHGLETFARRDGLVSHGAVRRARQSFPPQAGRDAGALGEIHNVASATFFEKHAMRRFLDCQESTALLCDSVASVFRPAAASRLLSSVMQPHAGTRASISRVVRFRWAYAPHHGQFRESVKLGLGA